MEPLELYDDDLARVDELADVGIVALELMVKLQEDVRALLDV